MKRSEHVERPRTLIGGVRFADSLTIKLLELGVQHLKSDQQLQGQLNDARQMIINRMADTTFQQVYRDYYHLTLTGCEFKDLIGCIKETTYKHKDRIIKFLGTNSAYHKWVFEESGCHKQTYHQEDSP